MVAGLGFGWVRLGLVVGCVVLEWVGLLVLGWSCCVLLDCGSVVVQPENFRAQPPAPPLPSSR